MQAILQAISSVWSFLVYIISGIRINDILDIVIIAYIIYKCIGFFRQTRGGQLVKGLLVLLVMAVIAQWFNLVMLKWLLKRLLDSILVVAIVIFQPELRRALESVGTSRIGSLGKNSFDSARDETIRMIESASKASGIMQEQKCGALMVFERNTKLGEIVSTGTVIDATPSSSIICNVFYPKSPLHDGGMIIRDGRVLAAGCILPLTQNSEYRHKS